MTAAKEQALPKDIQDFLDTCTVSAPKTVASRDYTCERLSVANIDTYFDNYDPARPVGPGNQPPGYKINP